jgi:hypothetical protein
MSALLIKLFLAHILGDFVLQPASWVKDKQLKKQRSPYLYLHGLTHALILLVLLRFDMQYLTGIILIVVSHLIFDLIKSHLALTINTRILFFGDQLAHLAVIAAVVYLYYPYPLDFNILYSPKALLLVTALATNTFVTSAIMKVIISKWDISDEDSDASLQHAGKYIGMLERLFVFGFVVMNQWQALGFLIAAKSIFRFGDLSRSRDRKLTEYILIGTLLSFGFALIIALGYQYLVDKLP